MRAAVPSRFAVTNGPQVTGYRIYLGIGVVSLRSRVAWNVTGASNTEPRRRSCVSCPVFGFPDFQKALGFTLNCHRVIHPKAQDFRKVWSSGGVFDVFRHRLGLKASSGVCQNVRIQSALQQLHILFAPSGTVNTSGRNIDKPETQNPNEVQLYRLPSSHGNPSNLDVYLYG